MTYDSPRDELLLSIVIAVAGVNVEASFGTILTGVAVFVAVGAYSVAAVSG